MNLLMRRAQPTLAKITKSSCTLKPYFVPFNMKFSQLSSNISKSMVKTPTTTSFSSQKLSMPFRRWQATATMEGFKTENRSETKQDKPIVGYWLLATGALTFGIVVLGGLTRLTESGLSITEWNIIKGMKWPSSKEEWQVEFDKYKQTPEYKILNHHMELNEFKKIFFFEWAHRMWGRFIGVFFTVPALYFLARGRLTSQTAKSVVGITTLIGFQGFLGWYMVKSGLDADHVSGRPIPVPRVSQYRLSAHLGTAFMVYAWCLMAGWRVLRSNKSLTFLTTLGKELADPRVQKFASYARATSVLTFITVISGAFVAGLDAGLVYNEWPLMGGKIVPDDIFGLSEVKKDVPIWKNFLENPTTVQFDHRMLAYTTLATVSALWMISRRVPLPISSRRAANLLAAVAWGQASLGIFTLLYLVPVELASAHQAGAMTLWTVALYLVHTLRRLPVK